MKTPLPRFACAAVLALSLAAAPTFAQSLFVISDRTVANGDPVHGNYSSVQVGIDAGFTPYPGVRADITGGTVGTGGVTAWGNSLVRVLDGTFQGNIAAVEDSQVRVFGGTMNGFVDAWDNARVHVAGGAAHADFSANGASLYDVSGGTVDGGFNAFENSRVRITGGSFSAFVSAYGDSVIDFDGATADGLSANENAVIRFLGGSVGSLYAENNSRFEVGGGLAPGGLHAYSDSRYVFRGLGLVSTLVGTFDDGDYSGRIFDLLLTTAGGDWHYTFTDIDADTFGGGSNPDTQFSFVSTTAPEPASLALVLPPLLIIASARGRRVRASRREGR